MQNVIQNTGNFSDIEVAERVEIVKQIVEAAFSIQGKILSPDALQKNAEYWEVAFRRVATEQLPDLYEVGISKHCVTAAQFMTAWEAKVIAEFEVKKHAAQQKRFDEVDSRPAADPNYLAEVSARFRSMANQSKISSRRSVVI